MRLREDLASDRESSGERLYTRRKFLRRFAAGGVTIACGGLIVGCGKSGLSGKLSVPSNPVRADEPFTVRLENLSPGQRVILRAKLADGQGQDWTSLAVFRADSQGRINLAKQAPLVGSYRGKDPMGLVWSASGPGRYHALSLHPRPVTITAEIEDSKTRIRVEQRLLGQHVTISDARDHGLYGKLFRPSGEDAKPGLLVFGGSDGGLSPYAVRQAALFADHGFVALALAYFGVDSLPKRLVNIPLEYFGRAIEWLRGQEGVRSDRLGAIGTSRGGELALILGSHYPELKAVVSYVGSGLVAPSPDGPQPAWTFRGKPLPRMPYTFDLSEITAAQKKRAEIPVERINGPVLLISGDDDNVWPSTQLSRIAMERLRRFDHPYQDEFVHYQGAGHGIQPPYLPTTAGLNYFGGDPKHNAEANEDSWPRVLRMLDEHMRH